MKLKIIYIFAGLVYATIFYFCLLNDISFYSAEEPYYQQENE